MVSCTECVHYQACRQWVEQCDKLIDGYNELARVVGSMLKTPVVDVKHCAFPCVAETKEELCKCYDKAKENV